MSNAKKAKPGIDVELGGETLTLVFDLWALAEVERKTGKTVSDLLGSGSMEGILVMLWAAARRFQPEITEEEVGHMIDFKDIPQLSDVLGKALSQASPDVNEGKDGKKKAIKQDGIG